MKHIFSYLQKEIDELNNEDGGVNLLLLPFLVIISTLLLCLLLNQMWISQNRYHTQLMLDSASRAGTLAVDYYYGVKERSGHGLGDYHVYTELDTDKAQENANAIINAYTADIKGLTISEIAFNPEDTESPVWNSRRFRYDNKIISSEKQYQNGNFTVKLNGAISTIAPDLFGGIKDTVVEHFSQSIARGTVTEVQNP